MEKQILQKLNEISRDLNSFKENVNDRFDTIDKKFDAIDTRFDAIDKRFEGIDTKFDANDSIFVKFSRELAVIKKSTLTMEHEHSQKLDLLLELNSHNYEQHSSYENRIVKLEVLTDLHSFELDLLKKSK